MLGSVATYTMLTICYLPILQLPTSTHSSPMEPAPCSRQFQVPDVYLPMLVGIDGGNVAYGSGYGCHLRAGDPIKSRFCVMLQPPSSWDGIESPRLGSILGPLSTTSWRLAPVVSRKVPMLPACGHSFLGRTQQT
ncbi:hypothetical protein F5X97DRAFT_300865 [Nemania serpens]|nr:hypothetical protein F5X97DRAFT_300865 [Nemania serpens]